MVAVGAADHQGDREIEGGFTMAKESHAIGCHIEGRLCRFFRVLDDEEFETEFASRRCGLPEGWVVWHVADFTNDQLREVGRLPIVLDWFGVPADPVKTFKKMRLNAIYKASRDRRILLGLSIDRILDPPKPSGFALWYRSMFGGQA